MTKRTMIFNIEYSENLEIKIKYLINEYHQINFTTNNEIVDYLVDKNLYSVYVEIFYNVLCIKNTWYFDLLEKKPNDMILIADRYQNDQNIIILSFLVSKNKID